MLHPLRLSGMQGISDEVRDSVAKADFFRPWRGVPMAIGNLRSQVPIRRFSMLLVYTELKISTLWL